MLFETAGEQELLSLMTEYFRYKVKEMYEKEEAKKKKEGYEKNKKIRTYDPNNLICDGGRNIMLYEERKC